MLLMITMTVSIDNGKYRVLVPSLRLQCSPQSPGCRRRTNVVAELQI